MAALEDQIKDQARALGFDLVGIAPATPADSFGQLRDWLDRGFAGEMGYMQRHADARREPSSILPDVKSVVMVALNYFVRRPLPVVRGSELEHIPDTGQDPSTDSALQRATDDGQRTPPQQRTTDDGQRTPPLQQATDDRQRTKGRIARYALGADYHDVLRQRLKELLGWIQQQVPGSRGRGVVDTAPLLERDFARRAGLGWFGKNTMLLNKQLGSYFFLAALLLDVELVPDAPHATSHCGRCTACLDACPTDAFVAPGVLDARRCISYLTIELRGPIPEELRRPLGDWLFGCDVCQEVCPWNRKAPSTREPAFGPRPELEAIDPAELLGLSEAEFRRRFRGTALWRTGRTGLLRNAAIVLGNSGDLGALPALQQASNDDDAAVREAAEWAIQQIAGANRG